MKISCQSCAAKYTIADEKVVGKVIKIKCKKCSSTIVVNGNDPSVLAQLGNDGGQGDDQATQLASRPPEPLPPNPDEWTVSVTDDDQRTMTTAQILAEYGAGGLSADTYVWKDGMGDWLPLHQVPELQPLLAATGAPASTPYAAPMSNPGMGMGMGMDTATPTPMAAAAATPFPTSASTAGNAAKRGSRASVDLFGGGGLEEVSRPAAPMPPPGISDRHVGERNETSVLFSLKDLAAAENAANKAPVRSPFADSERVDDLLSLGASGPAPMLAPPPMNTPFVEPPPPPPPSVAPVAASAIVSAYQPPPQKKSPLPIVLAGVGVAALLGAVVLFVMSGKEDPKPTASTSQAATTTEAKTSEPTAKAKDTASEPTAKPDDTSTATPEPTTTTSAVSDADPKATSTTTNTSKVALVDPTSTTKKEDPKPEPKEDPKPDPSDNKGGDAPFDRGAASAAMNGAAGAAKGCKKADGPTGSAKVQVTFAPSGKATQATVGAPFAGTAVGSCIASAFKGLSVPKFSGAAVTVGKTVNIK